MPAYNVYLQTSLCKNKPLLHLNHFYVYFSVICSKKPHPKIDTDRKALFSKRVKVLSSRNLSKRYNETMLKAMWKKILSIIIFFIITKGMDATYISTGRGEVSGNTVHNRAGAES